MASVISIIGCRIDLHLRVDLGARLLIRAGLDEAQGESDHAAPLDELLAQPRLVDQGDLQLAECGMNQCSRTFLHERQDETIAALEVVVADDETFDDELRVCAAEIFD